MLPFLPGGSWKLSIDVTRARNLIGVDRHMLGLVASTSDPYVHGAVVLSDGSSVSFLTPVVAKSLQPIWNYLTSIDCTEAGTRVPTALQLKVR